jgi:hypothetical protein
MKSKSVFWLLITVLLMTASSAEAQQPTKVPRIGYLLGPRFPFSQLASIRSARDCASLATSRGKTSSSSGALPSEIQNA